MAQRFTAAIQVSWNFAALAAEVPGLWMAQQSWDQELLWYIGVNRSAGLLKKTVASLGEAYLAV